MDAEVYWQGRQVGILRGGRVDQPYYLGEWPPADDPEFAAELAVRKRLPVVFRTPDGATTARRVPCAARRNVSKSTCDSVESRQVRLVEVSEGVEGRHKGLG
jgi:hypothetical protein